MDRPLNSTLKEVLQKIISTISRSLIIKLKDLPVLLNNENDQNKVIMSEISKQCVSEFQRCIQTEITCMFEEENLDELLETLTKLIASEEWQSSSGWRPSGIVRNDLRAHLLQSLLQKELYLLQLREEMVQRQNKTKDLLLNQRTILMNSVIDVKNKCNEIVLASQIQSNEFNSHNVH